ncbi:glycerophosphodiester phosphodiesterase [Salinibius halmophilus]|uniref:glycerophosphodiester phosphodiesterase n=1 Tax=Salinibius halmophilus TaxID=1853216 RepID=UPI000E665D65|nr:glycerophosphodiester phosphodiesterase [Salinibius halmophilus]
MKWLWRIALVVFASYGVVFWLIPPQSKASFHHIELIAHQGGNLEKPDATALAFDHAVAVGADILEMDVHLSKDGVPVVIHDALVDRTSNGQGAVADYTVAELKTLNFAHWWPNHQTPRANEPTPYRAQGAQILTLEEVFLRYPGKRLSVELKTPDPALRSEVVALLDEYNRWGSVILGSFHQTTIDVIRREHPGAYTYASEEDVIVFYVLSLLRLEGLFWRDISAFAVPTEAAGINLASKRFIDAARKRGIAVHYWTINDEATMRQLIDMGVDSIITDRPQLLRNIIDEGLQL